MIDISDGTKPCAKCKDTLPLDMFYITGTKKSGEPKLNSYCKLCCRALAKQYSTDHSRTKPQLKGPKGVRMSQQEIAELRAVGTCGICLRPSRIENLGLAIDHDHASGKVRDVLCHHCNVALGMFEENIALLTSAIEYIRRWRE